MNYFFSDRGAFRFDNIQALDLSVNYRLKLGRTEFFVQPELINVFNENSAFTGGVGILTADNDATLLTFNPYTEKPVEGVHWRKAATFGQARNVNDYQLGRTVRLSAGIRF